MWYCFKINKLRPERDYWYELRDNTFWMEARKNRLSIYDPGKIIININFVIYIFILINIYLIIVIDSKSYFLNNLKDFYYDQKLHYNKYKNDDFRNSKEYNYLVNHLNTDNEDDDKFIQHLNNDYYKT